MNLAPGSSSSLKKSLHMMIHDDLFLDDDALFSLVAWLATNHQHDWFHSQHELIME
jgi:hypothetical protein